MEEILKSVGKTDLLDILQFNVDDNLERRVQENLIQWQNTQSNSSFAYLNETKLDHVYQIRELLNKKYFTPQEKLLMVDTSDTIDNIRQFHIAYDWIEEDVAGGEMSIYDLYVHYLHLQKDCLKDLLDAVSDVTLKMNSLLINYNNVASKINTLHDVSECLMKQRADLKGKKDEINDKLKHFTNLDSLTQAVSSMVFTTTGSSFLELLERINSSIQYLELHPEYKETYSFKLRYEQLLTQCLSHVVRFIHSVIMDATYQVIVAQAPGLQQLAPALPDNSGMIAHTAFSYYYGKFLSASKKVDNIISYVEDNVGTHDAYERSLGDFYKSYFNQRSPIMECAVNNALRDLRERYCTDHGVLFRSAAMFIVKVCQDEDRCYNFFFNTRSQQLKDYMSSICQHLYDVLRPCLICINHIEVLSEICTILKEIRDPTSALDEFNNVRIQLLQDVEERLVFRTNVFFHYDLLAYQPSPGDLAYPEKLEQMEAVAQELDTRSDSRSSSISEESQEIANITSSNVGQFRSFTGNSPADLHGMWYPTVKRTLVCLSRLYICLDRETFQGVAQEGLLVCVKTVKKAADLIATRKTNLDALLFQIKHLLIIREQIAPFQVDFTATELSLDFSHMKDAAVGLVQNRDKIFKLGSNNAILEFLLDGTPRVKEYLVDSRKEIDKQLKTACEEFISHVTSGILIGGLLQAIRRAEGQLRIVQTMLQAQPLREFMPPQMLAGICTAAQRSIKTKIPDIQKSMRLYLANRETEFILFKPIKNNIINGFMELEQLFPTGKYSQDDVLLVGCPTTEQLNVLISSVSLASMDGEHSRSNN